MGRLADLLLHPLATGKVPTSEESGQHHVLLQVGSSCSSSSTSRPGAHAHVSRSTSITSFFEDNTFSSNSNPSNSGVGRGRTTTIKPARRTLFANGEEENKNGDVEQQASDEAEKDQEKSAEENAEGSADSEKQATKPDPKLPTEQEDDPADASGGLPTKPGSGDAAAFDAATGNIVDKGRSNLANTNPTENEDAGTDGASDQKSVQVVRAERLEKLIDQAKDTLAQLFSGSGSTSGGSAASSGDGDPNDEPGQPSLSEEDVKMIQISTAKVSYSYYD